MPSGKKADLGHWLSQAINDLGDDRGVKRRLRSRFRCGLLLDLADTDEDAGVDLASFVGQAIYALACDDEGQADLPRQACIVVNGLMRRALGKDYPDSRVSQFGDLKVILTGEVNRESVAAWAARFVDGSPPDLFSA